MASACGSTASPITRFATSGSGRASVSAGVSGRTRANPAETDPDASRPGRISAPPPARTSPPERRAAERHREIGIGIGLGRRRQRHGVELEPRLQAGLGVGIGIDASAAGGLADRLGARRRDRLRHAAAGANAAAAAARARGESAARRTDSGGRDAGSAGRSSTPGVANRGRSKDSGWGVRDAARFWMAARAWARADGLRPVDRVRLVRRGVEGHVRARPASLSVVADSDRS